MASDLVKLNTCLILSVLRAVCSALRAVSLPGDDSDAAFPVDEPEPEITSNAPSGNESDVQGHFVSSSDDNLKAEHPSATFAGHGPRPSISTDVSAYDQWSQRYPPEPSATTSLIP